MQVDKRVKVVYFLMKVKSFFDFPVDQASFMPFIWDKTVHYRR
jgi:hypothetical protein